MIEDCVTYDSREARLRYVDPGQYAQGIVYVSVHAPNFEMDRIVCAFNAYELPPHRISPSPFNTNVQEISHDIL